jgi:excisionase family DNA binding protein
MAKSARPLPESKSILATCGDTGLKEFSGRIREEFHQKLTGDRWLAVVKEMLYNESTLAGALLLIEMMIRSTNRAVKLNPSGHPQAAEAQEFIESCLEDMESTMQEVMIEAVSAIPWGYSYLEILYKIRKGSNDEPRLNSKHNDGRYGWRDWSPRAQESREEWSFTDEGRLLGMWQRVDRRSGNLFIPLDRAIHFRFRGSKQNPEGMSFFRHAYEAYHYAKNLRMIEAISLERDGAGLPDYQVPAEVMSPNADTNQKAIRADAENFVRKFRNDALAGVVRPSELDSQNNPTGYKFGTISASGKNIGAFGTTIIRHQGQMLTVFLEQFLAFGGVQQSGSHALGDAMTSQLGYAVSAINRAIDEQIERSAFARLLTLEGFHPDSWPSYVSADVEKQKLEATGAFVAQMVGAGAMEGGKDLDDWGRRQIDLEPKKGPSVGDMLGDMPDPEPIETEGPVDKEDQEQEQEQGEDELDEGEFMTSQEVADKLRIPKTSVHRAMRAGKMPGGKVGNRYLVSRDEFNAHFKAGA